MNDIERIGEALRKALPGLSVRISAPAVATGSWWLDALLHSHHVVVEWRPRTGFGVSTPSNDDYGEGADEIYAGRDEAFERVRRLLLSGGRTNDPAVLSLPNAS